MTLSLQICDSDTGLEGGGFDWQGYLYGRASTQFAFNCQAAAVPFDDMLDDRETQARTAAVAAASGIDTVKALREPG